jgi:hypothetical protein
MKNFTILLVLVTAVIVSSSSAQAECFLPIKTPFSAVALFKGDFLGRLENENRLQEICPTQDPDCVTKALSAYIDKMPVYDRPSGKVIASLEITYAPGKGITAALVQDGKTFPFRPPIYDNDWGYGPWFHATLLNQDGVWKNIALPTIQNGWVELVEPNILQLTEKESVYSLRDRNIIIIKFGKTSLTVRDEQPADMWCSEGNPSPLAPFKEEVILLNQVYDNQCNLLLSPAYTRGC